MTSRWKQSKAAREIYRQTKCLDIAEIFSLFLGLSTLLLLILGAIKLIQLIYGR